VPCSISHQGESFVPYSISHQGESFVPYSISHQGESLAPCSISHQGESYVPYSISQNGGLFPIQVGLGPLTFEPLKYGFLMLRYTVLADRMGVGRNG